jgi:hypothetical protein
VSGKEAKIVKQHLLDKSKEAKVETFKKNIRFYQKSYQSLSKLMSSIDMTRLSP